MTEFVWINGEVMPLSEARIAVEDRGFQFGDGVYEVTRVYDGRCFELAGHLDRLEGSSRGIKLRIPISRNGLSASIENLVERSELKDGIVYLQLTRGVGLRNHVFSDALKPTLLFYTRELARPPAPGTAGGITLHSVADVRWRLCWIKSISLLANILARTEAATVGSDEAVFVENGVVSECSTSNLFIVVKNKLITHPVGERVLPGITRAVLLDVARDLNVAVEERAIREDEAMLADEIFITSTTRELSWVSQWNGKKVGGGSCGQMTLRLHQAFVERVIATTRAGRHPKEDHRA